MTALTLPLPFLTRVWSLVYALLNRATFDAFQLNVTLFTGKMFPFTWVDLKQSDSLHDKMVPKTRFKAFVQRCFIHSLGHLAFRYWAKDVYVRQYCGNYILIYLSLVVFSRNKHVTFSPFIPVKMLKIFSDRKALLILFGREDFRCNVVSVLASLGHLVPLFPPFNILCTRPSNFQLRHGMNY